MTQVFLTIITNTEHPLISDASRSAGRARRGGALPPPGGGCCAQAQALSAALARSSLSNKCGRRFHTAISGEGVALCSLQHGGEWRSRGAGETPFCGRAKGKVEPGLALNSPSPFFSFPGFRGIGIGGSRSFSPSRVLWQRCEYGSPAAPVHPASPGFLQGPPPSRNPCPDILCGHSTSPRNHASSF